MIVHHPVGLEQEWIFDRLFTAYFEARRHKRSTANQLLFELDLERNLYTLYRDLAARTYELGPSIAFIVTEPKKREVFAATFRDRVVHHLVFDAINPYWERHFIFDSYSCRHGKGTHFAMERAMEFQRRVTHNFTRPAWMLKLDIQSYFTSIHHGKMLQIIERMYTDPKSRIKPEMMDLLRYLLPIIILARPTYRVCMRGDLHGWDDLPAYKTLFGVPDDRGFPIGNLTSQLFSNIYLGELDHFVKDVLGIKYYGRYVDDMILLDPDKDRLLAARDAIDEFLRLHLCLQLNHKKTILQPAAYGIPFVGGIATRYGLKAGKRVGQNYRSSVHAGRQALHDTEYYVQSGSWAGQLDRFVDGRYLQRGDYARLQRLYSELCVATSGDSLLSL